MSESNVLAALKKQHDAVNKYYEKYSNETDKKIKSIYGFILQVSIFQYELTHEIASVNALKPTGLARRLTFKGVVLKTYEYKNEFENRIILEFRDSLLSNGRKYPSIEINNLRKKYLPFLKIIDNLKDTRNLAAGHYRAIDKQIPTVIGVNEKEVSKAISMFCKYCNEIVLLIAIRNFEDIFSSKNLLNNDSPPEYKEFLELLTQYKESFARN